MYFCGFKIVFLVYGAAWMWLALKAGERRAHTVQTISERSQKARSRSFCSVTAQTIRINADSLLASSLKHDRDAAAKPCHNQKK